ncbi:MAG: ATP-binding protein, partial [Deltaproteobacteria bacterium]|nr:ATP-binding protein [Deltaproteobacteria bacterium]
AVLAHEIRNPLVSIRTFTQLLPERYLDEEYRESFLNLALSEVDRITALVNELLTFARPATHERNPLNLDEMVARVATLLESHARKSGVSLSIETDASIPPIIADEDKINQVLVNIVHNAIQACENRNKGRVTVSTGRGWINGSEAATLTISDDGCGMSEEQVEQAFEPFFTTRSEGTGLGLAIARQLVLNHGGAVAVDSTPGKGTTFTITLPVDSPALEQAADNFYAEGLIHA